MEKLVIASGSKEEIYKSIVPQIKSLIEGEIDLYANMANVSAALYEAFKHHWIGFYIVKNDIDRQPASLVLGPFQGPVACTRIGFGKGVCGTAWRDKRVVIVPDVDQFPGHIACSSLSKSEIVLPLFKGDDVFAVLDIDSAYKDTFDNVDARFLNEICEAISNSKI